MVLSWVYLPVPGDLQPGFNKPLDSGTEHKPGGLSLAGSQSREP